MQQRIFVKDCNSVYISCNQNYARDLGIEINSIAGKTDLDLYPRKLAEKYLADDHQVISSGMAKTIEEKYFHGGQEIWVRTNKIPLLNGKGEITGIVGSFEEITGYVKKQEALIHSEEYFRALIENSTDIILIVDEGGIIKYASPSVERFIGCKPQEMIGKLCFEFLVPDDRQRALDEFHEALLSSEVIFFKDFRMLHKNGTVHIFKGSGRNTLENNIIAGFILNVHDVTEEKKLEDQLRQVHRMEAIGTLASGIGHDFNNILTPILLGAEMVQLSFPEKSPAWNDLQMVIEAAYRAQELVQQILTFSRQGEEERRPLKLAPLVKETLKLIRSSLPSTIDIKQHIVAESDVVTATPFEIHQIIMNLCINAAHAMKENNGLLEIELTNVTLPSTDPTVAKNLKPGDYIKLSIRDNGAGMNKWTLEKIFDPFFTTREREGGTGMGLPVVQGIIENLQGEITVASKIKKGTTFKVYLPCTPKEIGTDSEKLETPPHGLERILFIDDEAAITCIYKTMLEQLEYDVIIAHNAVEALDLFRKEPERFDLIITDQTMPKMTGMQLAKELFRFRPDLPIILCTGFSQEESNKEAARIGIQKVLFKPVGRVTLAQAIRNLLDRKDITGRKIISARIHKNRNKKT